MAEKDGPCRKVELMTEIETEIDLTDLLRMVTATLLSMLDRLEKAEAALADADRVIRNGHPLDRDLDLPEAEFDALEMEADEFDRLVAESHARTLSRDGQS